MNKRKRWPTIPGLYQNPGHHCQSNWTKMNTADRRSTTVLRWWKHRTKFENTEKIGRICKKTLFFIQKFDRYPKIVKLKQRLSAVKIHRDWAKKEDTQRKSYRTNKPWHSTGQGIFARAVNHRNRRVADRSPKYDNTFSSYITEFVKEVKSQMNERFFDPKKPISIIGCSTTIKLAYDMNNLHDGAVVWGFSHYVTETLENELNSRVNAEDRLSTFVATVSNDDNRSRKLLQFYLEVMNYLSERYATAQAIAENEAEIVWYVQPPNVRIKQHTDDLIVKTVQSHWPLRRDHS